MKRIEIAQYIAVGANINIMIENINATIPVMISYGNGSISQPHFAIFPDILTAVPKPPKK